MLALRAALLLTIVAALCGCPTSNPRSSESRTAAAVCPAPKLVLAPQPAPARHLVAALP